MTSLKSLSSESIGSICKSSVLILGRTYYELELELFSSLASSLIKFAYSLGLAYLLLNFRLAEDFREHSKGFSLMEVLYCFLLCPRTPPSGGEDPS